MRYSAGDALVEELTTAQVPLGMFEAIGVSSATVTARSGDIYALVADGFTEVFDANDSELGLEPLKKTIRAYASRPLRDIVGRIVDVSRGYGMQRDGQTVLLIKVA